MALADQKEAPLPSADHKPLRGDASRQASAASGRGKCPRPTRDQQKWGETEDPLSLQSQHRLGHHDPQPRPRGWPAGPRRPSLCRPHQRWRRGSGFDWTVSSETHCHDSPPPPSANQNTSLQPISAAASDSSRVGGPQRVTALRTHPAGTAVLGPAYSSSCRHCGKQTPPQTPAGMQGWPEGTWLV